MDGDQDQTSMVIAIHFSRNATGPDFQENIKASAKAARASPCTQRLSASRTRALRSLTSYFRQRFRTTLDISENASNQRSFNSYVPGNPGANT
jgi:hypothetical protein